MERKNMPAPSMRSLNEGHLKRLYFDFVAYRDSNDDNVGMGVLEFYQREWRRYV